MLSVTQNSDRQDHGSNAVVYFSPANSTQDGCGRFLPYSLVNLNGRERRIVVGNKSAKNGCGQRNVFFNKIRFLTAMGGNMIPEQVQLENFSCLGIHPIKCLIFLFLAIFSTFGTSVALEVNSEFLSLLLPPGKVDMKLCVEGRFYIFGHIIIECLATNIGLLPAETHQKHRSQAVLGDPHPGNSWQILFIAQLRIVSPITVIDWYKTVVFG